MTSLSGGFAPRSTRARRVTLRLSALLSGAALAAVTPAVAANVDSRPHLAQLAQAAPVGNPASIAFNIPAQPLDSALTTLADQAGLHILFTSAEVAGLRAPAVSGRLPATEALNRLLAGSGFTYRFANPGTVTLVPAPRAGGPVVLPPVTVEAQRQTVETAWGPARGFVAARSASATKTDTPLAETPQSISVVTREEMTTRNVRNIAEALAYTPGVRAGTMGASNGYGGDSTSIRGFGGDGTAGPSSNEYIDGMRLKGTGYVMSGIDPFAFERVEVIKGPASVLYGQSTPGGLVNMVSKRPSDTPFGEIELQTGSHDRLQGSVDFGDRLDQAGTLSYRLSALAFDAGTQTDFTDRKRLTIAPSLTWTPPSGDTSLTILTRYQKDDFGGTPLNWLPAVGTVLANPFGQIDRSFFAGDPNYMRWQRENYALGYIFEHQFDETWTVRQNFRYTRNNLDHQGVYISTMANARTANRQAFGMIEHGDDTTLDNQVQANLRTGPVRHTVLAGLDGQIMKNDTDRVLQSPAATIDVFNPTYYRNFPVTPYQRTEGETQQYGLYLQDQLKWDRLIFVLGLRQDWAENGSTNLLTNTSTNQKDDKLTKRGAVMYQFASGFSPYLSYSESFDPTSATLFGNVPAKPTEGQQYEIGVKYQPPGYNSFITASAFDLTRQNVTTRDLVNLGFSTQTGEVRSRGLELEAKASLAEGFNLTAGYTLLDTEVTDSNDTATGITGAVVTRKGKALTKVPRHAASLWADYSFQAGSTLNGFGFGGGLRYTGETFGDDANSFKVPSFTLVDAMLRYDLSALDARLAGWHVTLNATNLFDEEYVSACTAAVRCYYGDGRTVYASMKYRW